MHWKGPFNVLTTVGANDYRINVNGEEKTFQANLLKRYITRDAASDETPTSDGSVSQQAWLLWRTMRKAAAVMIVAVKSYRSLVAGVARRQ
ncbi:Zinc finger protein [Plakobranchus ocellatus]|uniref:Zinc finger protein n=1 Tax=Plakobranchus ocellatus TaxID=259542 RepID=A0AAV3ZJG6_9GAST|nr:Zinc finger protein [Plakobranchus ocellatus]